MSKGKDKPVRFEQAVEQLEGIIEEIESGQVGLEESLAKYEQGMKLVERCKEILAGAEKRIAELTMDAQGRLKEVGGGGEEEVGEDSGP